MKYLLIHIHWRRKKGEPSAKTQRGAPQTRYSVPEIHEICITINILYYSKCVWIPTDFFLPVLQRRVHSRITMLLAQPEEHILQVSFSAPSEGRSVTSDIQRLTITSVNAHDRNCIAVEGHTLQTSITYGRGIMTRTISALYFLWPTKSVLFQFHIFFFLQIITMYDTWRDIDMKIPESVDNENAIVSDIIK